MAQCESDVLEVCSECDTEVHAWCILPNHYHLLVNTDNVINLRKSLGRFHGRSSYFWNKQDEKKGRKVWFNSFERPMRSERHFWASINYIHNNPVHHWYAKRWQDWPWSSAADFLERVGRERAAEIWKGYPLLEYGKDWDI
jgi:REP-associated tyrosine transposase